MALGTTQGCTRVGQEAGAVKGESLPGGVSGKARQGRPSGLKIGSFEQFGVF